MLPTLYDRWMSELLPAGAPDETRATCSSCAMRPSFDRDPNEPSFDADVKCCSYYPDLSNFRVGMILADPDTAEQARAVLQKRLATRLGVSPLGVAAAPFYSILYQQSVGVGMPRVFGRTPALRCPFYQVEGGTCGVWRNREAICSTWYCRFEHGVYSRRFWGLLKLLLRNLDQQLAVWCLPQLMAPTEVERALIGETSPQRLDEHVLNNTYDPGQYKFLWGTWEGREAELFAGCARLVAPLTGTQVVEIAGARARVLVDLVARSRGALDAPAMPERATRGKGLLQLGRKPATATVRNPLIPYDSVDVPADALRAVPRLAAAPLADARRDLAAEGIAIDDETIRTLLDYEVLNR